MFSKAIAAQGVRIRPCDTRGNWDKRTAGQIAMNNVLIFAEGLANLTLLSDRCVAG